MHLLANRIGGKHFLAATCTRRSTPV